MKKIVLSAMVVAALAGSAMAQNVTFRLRERFGDTTIGGTGDADPATTAATNMGANVAGSGSDRTLWYIVEAMISGGPQELKGIAGFAGSINITSGAGGGVFKRTAAGFNASPTSGAAAFTFADAPNRAGAGGAGQRGIFEPYRLVANLGESATGLVTTNGIGEIAGATGGGALGNYIDGTIAEDAFGLNVWIPVYTFQYDVTDLTARDLTFTTNFQASGWTTFSGDPGEEVPNSLAAVVTQGSATVAIVPAPGAMALLGLGGLVAARRRRA